MDVKELTDALQVKFNEMQETVKASTQAEIKGLGVADLEEKQAKLDKALDEAESKLQAEVEAGVKAQAKVEELEKKITNIQIAWEREGGKAIDEKKAEDIKAEAINKYLRKGDERTNHFSEDEFKSLSRDSDPDGGYHLAVATQSLITNYLFETSDVRGYANIIDISTDHFPAIVSNGGSTCGWVGEKETRGETETPRFQTKKIYANEMYAQPAITNLMLDDASFDIETWLAGETSSTFARTEATAFTSGDGIEKPRGFLTYPDGVITVESPMDAIERIASGAATAITADAFYDMEGALKTAYLKNANWFINRRSLTAIRKLKDGDDNAIWNPGFDGKTGSTILGYGYARFEDMPQIGAGALPIGFGDLKETYQIVDRIGVRVQRDSITQKGKILFYTTKRVGGDVKNFESFKLMEIKA